MSAIRGICNTIFGPVKQAGKYVCNKSEFVNSVFTEVREPLMALKETRAQTIGVAKKMQAGTTTSSAKKVFNFIFEGMFECFFGNVLSFILVSLILLLGIS